MHSNSEGFSVDGEVSIVLSVLLIPSRQYLTDLGKIGSSKRNLATELGFMELQMRL